MTEARPAPTRTASPAPPVRTDGGFRIQAEKWFVTTGDVADYYIVMVNVVDGDDRLPTLFLVDRDVAGITFLETRRSRTTTRTAIRRSCSTSRCRPTPCSAARR